MATNKQKAGAAVIAAAFAAPLEGMRQVAYYDPPGIMTVCEGHTGPDVVWQRRYSIAECNAFMTADMRKAVDQVDRCAPGAPRSVLVAFADATFNLGSNVACNVNRSTAAKLLRAGDFAGACRHLLDWNKARIAGVLVALPGLTKRRRLESELCLKGLP
jgi:lysozyme